MYRFFTSDWFTLTPKPHFVSFYFSIVTGLHSGDKYEAALQYRVKF